MHQLLKGMKKSRGNLDTSNRLEKLQFPAAHSMGTELQGSGRCTVPIQPHRKRPHELLVPMTNTDAIYYLKEKILVQTSFTVELGGKRYYLRYKICSWSVLLYRYGGNSKDRMQGAVSVRKLLFQTTQHVCFVGCFPQCDREGFYSVISETWGNVNKKRLTKINIYILSLSFQCLLR